MIKLKVTDSLVDRLCGEQEVRFLLGRLQRHAPEVYRRSLRMARLYEAIAGLKPEAAIADERTLRSVLLQDIGYLCIPLSGLHDPRQQVEHPSHGVKILAAMVLRDQIDPAIILHHHENLDGTGYPEGLGWKQLHQPCRVSRIVEHIELMTGGGDMPHIVVAAMEDLFCWSDVVFDREWVELLNHELRKDFALLQV